MKQSEGGIRRESAPNAQRLSREATRAHLATDQSWKDEAIQTLTKYADARDKHMIPQNFQRCNKDWMQ